jgi:hypothetical protein
MNLETLKMSSLVLLLTPFYAICLPFQEALSGNPTVQSYTIENINSSLKKKKNLGNTRLSEHF